MKKIIKGLICVVLCAGRGLRITPYSETMPKVMIKIKDKPVLGYVIDYWKNYTNNFIFVVGYKKEQVIDYVSSLPIKAQFIEQKELRGIADAISYVKDFITDDFIVVLGDCLCHGQFNMPKNMKQGVGVWKTDDVSFIKQNYSVEIKGDVICRVCEKPTIIINNLCGMGVYLFNKKVFDYIKNTKPSELRNEVEITDTIQNMINDGEEIKPIFFKGKYLNVTYPYDVKEAQNIIFRPKKRFD